MHCMVPTSSINWCDNILRRNKDGSFRRGGSMRCHSSRRHASPNSGSNGNLLTVGYTGRPRANSFREMSDRLTTVNGKSGTPVVKVSCFNESSSKSIIRRSGSLTPSPSVHSYKKRGSFRANEKQKDKTASEAAGSEEAAKLLIPAAATAKQQCADTAELPTSKSSSSIKNSKS